MNISESLPDLLAVAGLIGGSMAYFTIVSSNQMKALEKRMDLRFDNIDIKFGHINDHLNRIDDQINHLKSDISDIKTEVDQLKFSGAENRVLARIVERFFPVVADKNIQ